MRGRTWCLALVVGSLTTAVASAQSYTLKIKSHADVGKSVTVSDSAKINVTFSVASGGNVLKEDKKATTESAQYTEKVLAADDKGRTKFTRTYGKVTKDEDGQTATPSYAGKTVVFERRGDKTVATADGVDAKDLKALTKSVNDSVDEAKLVPPGAVAVGETWTIAKDVFAPLLGEMKEGADVAKAKATGKLTKVYKKAGQQWGTIEVSLAVPVKKFGPLALEKPIPFQVKVAIDAAIDGSSTASHHKAQLTIKGRSEFEQNGQTFTLDVRIEGDVRQEQSAEK